MQCKLQVFIRFKDFEKRQIAVLISLFDDSIEIANWLMVMQDQAESNRVFHRASPNGFQKLMLDAHVVQPVLRLTIQFKGIFNTHILTLGP